MKKLFLILLVGLVVLMPFILTGQVSGQEEGPPEIIVHYDQIGALIDRVITFVWGIMVAVVTLMLLYAGFTFVTAGGNEEQIGKAKDMIKYSLIGIVVMLLANGVLWVVRSFLESV